MSDLVKTNLMAVSYNTIMLTSQQRQGFDKKLSPSHYVVIQTLQPSSTDDSAYSPAESTRLHLNKDQLDELISLLQEHRAMMNPVEGA